MQHRRHRRLRRQRRAMDLAGHHQRLAARQRRVQERQPLRGRHPLDPQPRQARQVCALQVRRHAAALAPVAPGDRSRRQAPGAPPVRERVQDRVRRRVVALPRRSHHPSHRREQHERGQLLVFGQLIEVQRAVHLRPEHPVDALGRLRRQHAVVERAGRVKYATQIRDRLQQAAHRVPIRHVARHDLDRRSRRLQLRGERLGSRRRSSLPRGQHQPPHAVGRHHMARHQRSQRPRTAGDQHRPIAELRLSLRAGPARARQSWRQQLALAQRQLCLARRQRRRQRVLVFLVVDVEHHQLTVGVLALGRPHQAPQPGLAQVADVLVRRRRHRSPRHHHQPRRRVALIGQPRLQDLEQAMRLLVRRRLRRRGHCHHLYVGHRRQLGRLRTRRHRRPLHLVQPIAPRAERSPQLLAGRGAGVQPVDDPERLSGRVGDPQLHRLVVAAEPHANLGRARRPQRHA